MKTLIILYITFTVLEYISSFRSPPASFPRTRLSISSSVKQEDNDLIIRIKTALIHKPNEEPLLFNLGILLGQKLENTDAEQYEQKSLLIAEILDVFDQAVKINKERDASWFNIASLKQQVGDDDGAIIAYMETIKKTTNADLMSASYSNSIQLLLAKSDLNEASRLSSEAVNALPEDNIAWCNMGIILRDSSSYDEAIKCFENSLIFSDGMNGIALNNLGNIYIQTDELIKASEYYNQAVLIDPYDEESTYSLAMLLRDAGDTVKATEMFQNCLNINPSNSAASFQLSAIEGDTELEQCPPEYVSNLFDHYATKGYDSHMVKDLKYLVPDYLWDAFMSVPSSSNEDETPKKPLTIVELGVGTGLTGARFRKGLIELNNEISEFSGCDLSTEMIMRAYELMFQGENTRLEPVYTNVAISDCSEYLQKRHSQGNPSADLILAGDVLVYMGKLDVLFERVKSCLTDSGKFLFSVEKMEGYSSSGYVLLESARFAHSQGYIKEMASKSGLEVLSCNEVPLRSDGGVPVNGYIYVLQLLPRKKIYF
jgi:predicted TPR repeat methyltransferase